MNYLVNRVKEPSTWAGFAVVVLALRSLLPQYAAVLDVAAAVAGCVGGAMPEAAKQGGYSDANFD